MNVVVDIVSAVLLLGGAVLAVLGALLQVDDAGAISKIVVIVVLQLVTAPIGAHMLSRAISRGENSDPPTPD